MNLAAAQDFRLPNASSAFVGDWCGIERTTDCRPSGTCDDEQAPVSLSFYLESDGGWLSSNHVVVMRYQILAATDVDIRGIQVNAPDPQHVNVSYTLRQTNSLGIERLVNIREQLISFGSGSVQETEDFNENESLTGASYQQTVAQLKKCSPEFLRMQDEYQKEHGLEAKAQVSGQVP